jgi:hypothetical protein
LRILYETGVYDVDALQTGFAKVGYSPEDAKDLATATAKIAAPAKAKTFGLPSVAEIVSLYKSDGLSLDDAKDMLQNSGVEFNDVGNILTTADAQRDAARRKQLVSALKKRFMDGDFDSGEVTNRLLTYGVDASRTAVIIAQWSEELSLVHKVPAAQNLCKWFTSKFIDLPTYMQRMQNLGYTPADAALFVNSCVEDAAKAAAKESAAQAKQAAADLAKKQKAELKAIKDAAPCRPPTKPVCGAAPKQPKNTQSSSSGTG